MVSKGSASLGRALLTVAIVALGALVGSGWTTLARAQEVSVEASLDRSAATLDDQIRLDVVLRGQIQGRPQVRAPDLDDFRILQSGTSQSHSFVNGQLDASYTYTYILMPLEEGEHTIPSFTITYRGQDYKTEPLRLVVSGHASTSGPSTSPQEQNKDIFVIAQVDKEKVYVNEQILYTFYLYCAPRVSNLSPGWPKFEGFWKETLEEGEKQYHKIVNGRRYTVIEVSTAIFPTHSGTLTIEPAVLRLVQISERSFSFFDRGVDRTFRTRPVEVEVMPLPAAGRPADFDGAVGENMKISARLDRREVPEGEPLTLTVTLTGSGNVRTFSKPRLPELPQFKTYDADSKTEVRNLDHVQGTRLHEFVLVPRGPGEFTIPPVRLSYFDTGSASYKTLETEPFHVISTPVATAAQANGLGLPADPQEIEVVGRDIAHIRTNVPVSDDWTPLYTRGFFLVFAPLPLFALGLAVVVQRRREHLATNVAMARSSRARKVAHKRLAQAQKLLAANQSQEFYAETQRALLQYVGDKLNVAAAGLVYDVLYQKLLDAGASREAGADLVRLLEHCDAARFAPGSSTPESMRSTIRDVEGFVTRLEEAWNRKRGRFVMAHGAAVALVLGLAFLPLVGASQAQESNTSPASSQAAPRAQDTDPVPASEPAASTPEPEPAPLRESGLDFTPPQELLQRGHAAYESGRYIQAVEAYRTAEAYGVRNASLYYDLGNAYFKNGQLGEAIAMYRRAERLAPRDELVQANLEFVLARREDKAVQPAVPFPLDLLRALYRQMSLNEWILCTALLYVACCGLAMVRILRRDRRFLLRLGLPATLVALLFASTTLAYKIYDERGLQRGVVSAGKIAVMSGPGKDYTVEFWLHEGSEVQIDEVRPDWARVSMGSKLRGWIPLRSLVRI